MYKQFAVRMDEQTFLRVSIQAVDVSIEIAVR